MKEQAEQIYRGRHLDVVNENLAVKMDAVERFGRLNNWDQQQYANALQGIIKEERQLLKIGERMLNKNCRPNAIPLEDIGK